MGSRSLICLLFFSTALFAVDDYPATTTVSGTGTAGLFPGATDNVYILGKTTGAQIVVHNDSGSSKTLSWTITMPTNKAVALGAGSGSGSPVVISAGGTNTSTFTYQPSFKIAWTTPYGYSSGTDRYNYDPSSSQALTPSTYSITVKLLESGVVKDTVTVTFQASGSATVTGSGANSFSSSPGQGTLAWPSSGVHLFYSGNPSGGRPGIYPNIMVSGTASVVNYDNVPYTIEVREALSGMNIYLGSATAATNDAPGTTSVSWSANAYTLGFDVRGRTFTLYVDGVAGPSFMVPLEATTDYSATWGTVSKGSPADINDEPLPQPTPTPVPFPSPPDSPDPVPTPNPTPQPLPSGTPSLPSSTTYTPFGSSFYPGGNPNTSSMTKDDFYDSVRRGVEDADGGSSSFEVEESEPDPTPDYGPASEFGEKVSELVGAWDGFLNAGLSVVSLMEVYFPVYQGSGSPQTFEIPLPNGPLEIDFSQTPGLPIIRLLAGLFIITCGIHSAMAMVRGAFVDQS